MRTERPPGKLTVMEPAETIRLALEIERGREPLSGRLGPHAGQPREFVGWSGLAAALTSALEDDAGERAGRVSTSSHTTKTQCGGTD